MKFFNDCSFEFMSSENPVIKLNKKSYEQNSTEVRAFWVKDQPLPRCLITETINSNIKPVENIIDHYLWVAYDQI